MIMNKLFYKIFILLIITVSICSSQYRGVLPPAPIMSDSCQIEVILKTNERTLKENNQSSIGSLSVLSNDITILGDTSATINKVNSLKISTLQIKDNSATALCKVNKCDGSILNDVILRFEKKGFYWEPVESDNLIDETVKTEKDNGVKRNDIQTLVLSQSNVLTPAMFKESNKMLISTYHPWTHTQLLTAGSVSSYLGVRLFCDDVKLDMDALYVDLTNNPVCFFIDHYWNRIVYARKGSPAWIHSYGDRNGDHKFAYPKGMAVDILDTIYVADTDHGKIVKLWYNNADIIFQSSFNVDGITHPVDIDIDQAGSLSRVPTPQGDRIWIADDFTGKIISINRSGVIKSKIEYYSVPYVGSFRLLHPSKVVAHNSSMIAFIDRDRMAFVTASPPPWGGTVANAYKSTEFNTTTSDLTCIGQDLNNEWWVGDVKQMMYHKFTSDGEYVASCKMNGDFKSPVSISKATYVKEATPNRSQYIYTSDLWGTNTGMRAFFPGVDALDTSFIPSYDQCNAGVRFLLTNQAKVRGRLWTTNDTTTKARYDYGILPAGWQTVKIPKFHLQPNVHYNYTLELLPCYWDSYGMGQYEYWSSYTKTFWSPQTLPDWGAHIEPVPSDEDCFGYAAMGTWKVVPMCYEGFYSYSWFKNSYKGDYNWSHLSGNSNQISFSSPGGTYELKCEVTAIDNSKWNAYYTNCPPPPPPPPPPPSCPFVYTWDGKEFNEDNNILPQSEYPENIGKDVTDYYRLLKPLKSDNGKYILQIREFEHEKSHLDQFKLLAVDHPTNTKIDVSPSGEIYQYVTPFTLNRARLKGIDVIQKLLAIDSSKVELNEGDTLNLSLSNLNSKISRSFQSTSGGGEGGGDDVPKVEKIAYIKPTTASSPNPAGFSFRQRPTLVFVPFTLNNTNSFDIIWKQKARLDYFNFGVTVPKTYLSQELSLASAIHSANGDVKGLLLSKDNNYTTLTPGQSIELRYNSISPPSTNMKRTFILISEGRYEKYIDSSRYGYRNQSQLTEVTSFKLQRNYPNPFNPVTRIDFQLPIDGHVTLVIYDLIGREVKRLVDSYVTKGYHNFEWDASNYSSGLYICRYTVTDNFGKELYSEIQKLIVMR